MPVTASKEEPENHLEDIMEFVKEKEDRLLKLVEKSFNSHHILQITRTRHRLLKTNIINVSNIII